MLLSLWKKETTSSKRRVHSDEPPVSSDTAFTKTLLPADAWPPRSHRARRLSSSDTGLAPGPPSSWRPTAPPPCSGEGAAVDVGSGHSRAVPSGAVRVASLAPRGPRAGWAQAASGRRGHGGFGVVSDSAGPRGAENLASAKFPGDAGAGGLGAAPRRPGPLPAAPHGGRPLSSRSVPFR